MPRYRLAASILGLIVSVAFVAPALSAAQHYISVPLDEVRILTFDTPVKTVYVGNPTIADLTVIDSKHVFLQGKSFGTTNLLGLDSSGKPVVEEHISVQGHQGAVVTVQRGAARQTLNCASQRCEAMPTPGDENGPFDMVTGQVDKRQEQNLKAAAVGTAGGAR